MTATLVLRFVLAPLLALLALLGGAAGAEPLVERAAISERGRDLVVNADASLELTASLEDAAARGLPLYFTVEVEVNRPRWYWFDEKVLAVSQVWRISHNPLTRQWRVGTGTLALPVGSLAEALSVVRHVRNWRIADRDALRAGSEYQARIRVRFDVSQLSKPFQVGALSGGEWSLSTPWREFRVVLSGSGESGAGGPPAGGNGASSPPPPPPASPADAEPEAP